MRPTASPSLRPAGLVTAEVVAAAAGPAGAEGPTTRAANLHAGAAPSLRPMSALTRALGFAVFLAWMGLFGAGIMVDTSPYRHAISPEGARLLRAEGELSQPVPAAELAPVNPPVNAPPAPRVPGMAESWAVSLFCFLPLNLAWLCLAASTLGAVGNMANLGSERDPMPPHDASSPLLSAMLRGFFVYLFLMSGMLLLDHAPFSGAGPNQYIRLAGFLSLFSFLVSYHPQLFGTLIVSAFERIQVRAGDRNAQTQSVEHSRTSASIEIERVTTAAVSEGSGGPRREGPAPTVADGGSAASAAGGPRRDETGPSLTVAS